MIKIFLIKRYFTNWLQLNASYLNKDVLETNYTRCLLTQRIIIKINNNTFSLTFLYLVRLSRSHSFYDRITITASTLKIIYVEEALYGISYREWNFNRWLLSVIKYSTINKKHSWFDSGDILFSATPKKARIFLLQHNQASKEFFIATA